MAQLAVREHAYFAEWSQELMFGAHGLKQLAAAKAQDNVDDRAAEATEQPTAVSASTVGPPECGLVKPRVLASCTAHLSLRASKADELRTALASLHKFASHLIDEWLVINEVPPSNFLSAAHRLRDGNTLLAPFRAEFPLVRFVQKAAEGERGQSRSLNMILHELYRLDVQYWIQWEEGWVATAPLDGVLAAMCAKSSVTQVQLLPIENKYKLSSLSPNAADGDGVWALSRPTWVNEQSGQLHGEFLELHAFNMTVGRESFYQIAPTTDQGTWVRAHFGIGPHDDCVRPNLTAKAWQDGCVDGAVSCTLASWPLFSLQASVNRVGDVLKQAGFFDVDEALFPVGNEYKFGLQWMCAGGTLAFAQTARAARNPQHISTYEHASWVQATQAAKVLPARAVATVGSSLAEHAVGAGNDDCSTGVIGAEKIECKLAVVFTNLRSNEVRAKHMTQSLRRLITHGGAPQRMITSVNRFDAIRGVPTADAGCELHPGANGSSITTAESWAGRKLKPQDPRECGAMGSYASYLTALHQFAAQGENGPPFLLLLQDDVVVRPELFERLPTLLAPLPRWHALRFDVWPGVWSDDLVPGTKATYRATRRPEREQPEDAKPTKTRYAYLGAHATLVQRATVNELIASLVKCGTDILDGCLKSFANDDSYHAFAVQENLVRQSRHSAESDIAGGSPTALTAASGTEYPASEVWNPPTPAVAGKVTVVLALMGSAVFMCIFGSIAAAGAARRRRHLADAPFLSGSTHRIDSFASNRPFQAATVVMLMLGPVYLTYVWYNRSIAYPWYGTSFFWFELLTYLISAVRQLSFWCRQRRDCCQLSKLEPAFPRTEWPMVHMIFTHYTEPAEETCKPLLCALQQDYPPEALVITVADDGYFKRRPAKPQPASPARSRRSSMVEASEKSAKPLISKLGRRSSFEEPSTAKALPNVLVLAESGGMAEGAALDDEYDVTDSGRAVEALIESVLAQHAGADAQITKVVRDVLPTDKAEYREACAPDGSLVIEYHVPGLPLVRLIGRRAGAVSHAKCGNLDNAVMNVLEDDVRFVALFDADMAPEPEFVQCLLPQFFRFDGQAWRPDWVTGFVSTHQAFENIERVYGTHDPLNQSDRVFYDGTQCALDTYGLSWFNGTNCIFFVPAVKDSGGFAYGCMTEDTLTGSHVHSYGWKSAFIGSVHGEFKQLAAGLCRETTQESYVQRKRWASGNQQHFFLERPFSLLPFVSDTFRLPPYRERFLEGLDALRRSDRAAGGLAAPVVHAEDVGAEERRERRSFGWVCLNELGYAFCKLGAVLILPVLYTYATIFFMVWTGACPIEFDTRAAGSWYSSIFARYPVVLLHHMLCALCLFLMYSSSIMDPNTALNHALRSQQETYGFAWCRLLGCLEGTVSAITGKHPKWICARSDSSTGVTPLTAPSLAMFLGLLGAVLLGLANWLVHFYTGTALMSWMPDPGSITLQALTISLLSGLWMLVLMWPATSCVLADIFGVPYYTVDTVVANFGATAGFTMLMLLWMLFG